MKDHISLRAVAAEDLPTFFVHQLDPEACRLAAFPSRDREAFFAHWTTNILGNPAAVCRTILANHEVAGHIGAWTDADSGDRMVGYWIGPELWGRGIASAALVQFIDWEPTRPLSARVANHNCGSIRVLEKAGFVRVAEEAFFLPGGARIEEILYRLAA